jgi:hypothetical protein
MVGRVIDACVDSVEGLLLVSPSTRVTAERKRSGARCAYRMVNGERAMTQQLLQLFQAHAAHHRPGREGVSERVEGSPLSLTHR